MWEDPPKALMALWLKPDKELVQSVRERALTRTGSYSISNKHFTVINLWSVFRQPKMRHFDNSPFYDLSVSCRL